jgi:two-component system chemotaxis response regulator CheY
MEKRKARVLIADDEEHIRSLLGMIMSSLGAEVIAEASDGQMAIDLFRRHMPDMVMLDINMPKIDGIEVLKQIMTIKPKTLVVMLSSLNALEVVKECIDNGAWNYLLKNATADELRIELSQTWQNYMSEMNARIQS